MTKVNAMEGTEAPPAVAVGPPSVTEADISCVVDDFYDRVRRDCTIGPIFDEKIKDWPTHLAHLKRFWSSVLLGTGTFQGDPMGTHLGLPLKSEHFERWLSLFAATTKEKLTPDQAELFNSRAERIAMNFRHAIVFQQKRHETSS